MISVIDTAGLASRIRIRYASLIPLAAMKNCYFPPKSTLYNDDEC